MKNMKLATELTVGFRVLLLMVVSIIFGTYVVAKNINEQKEVRRTV